MGNWTTTTITHEGGSPATQSRTHNKLNEVTQYGTTTVLYDHGNNSGSGASRGNGNIVDDGVRTYAYDVFNRLTTIKRKSDGATIGQYTYDAMGRRIRKTVSSGGLSGTIANGTTRYLYNQSQCVEELDVSGTTTRQFIWGQYIDELIQLKTYVGTGTQPLPAGVYYLLSDLLYRSAALTDNTGAIKEAYDTDAYGNTIIYSGPGADSTWFTNDDVSTLQPACEYIFTGRQYDPESQIYFYRARYYHPQLGRFVSRDSNGYDDGLNLYEYVNSNPVTNLDPEGLQPTKPCCCCCVDSLTLGNVVRQDYSNFMGHEFDVDIGSSYVKSATTQDCTLEWSENTNIPYPGFPGGANQWVNLIDSGASNLMPWFNRRQPCPGNEPVHIHDDPGIGIKPNKTETRRLAWRIVVTSGKDCDCANNSKTLHARQKLTEINGKPIWSQSEFV